MRSAVASIVAGLVLVGCGPAGAGAAAPVLATFDYDGEGTVHKVLGSLEVTIDAIGLADARGPRLRVAIDGNPALKLQLKGESSNGSAKATIVRLEGVEPQILFQHFTYGAHCCVVSKIATKIAGHWRVVPGETLDGEGGYDFLPIDGGGHAALIASDQSFLYAFTGYASSLAPIEIKELQGDHLVDITREARVSKVVIASLQEIEASATKNDLWHENGFLAAWVATKALLGEGPAAWAKMLKNFDDAADWQPDHATFPDALRAKLLDRGYIHDPSLYPSPPKGSAAHR